MSLNTKSVLLFPGLDALFVASKIKRWIDYPYIKSSLREASDYLSQSTLQDENLEEFLSENRRPHLHDFDRTLVVLTALQIGIARELLKEMKFDYFLGCSHGDVARSVMCESMSYRDAIDILWTFAMLRKICPKGQTANVRPVEAGPISNEQIAWLESQGAAVSFWSDRNATIAGEVEFIEKLSSSAGDVGLKVKPVLPYPVHSPTMEPMRVLLESEARRWKIKAPNQKIFSSVWNRELLTPEDIRREGLESSIKPVAWVKTLEEIYNSNVSNVFVNVGPSNTLTGWVFENKRFERLEIRDGWDLLNSEESSWIA